MLSQKELLFKMLYGKLELFVVVVTLFLFTGGITLTFFASNGDEQSSLMQLVWGILYLISFTLIFIYKGRPIKIITADKWLMITLIICILSILWSFDYEQTMRRLIALIGTTAFGVFLAWRYSVREIVNLLAISLGLSALLSLCFVLLLPSYGVATGIFDGNWKGVYTHKNHLGRFMTLGSFALLLMAIYTRKYRTAKWGMFFLTVLLVVKSNSKSALIILLLVVVCSFLIKVLNFNTYILISFITVLFLFSAILIAGVFLNADYLTNLIGRDLTLTGRTEIWQAVLDKIKEHPILGYGYNAFWSTYSEYSYVWKAMHWEAPHAHNGYLELILDIGLIGFLPFIMGLIVNFYKSIKIYILYGTIEGVWMIGFLLILLVSSITEITFMRTNNIYWVLYVASVLSLRTKGVETKTNTAGIIKRNILVPVDRISFEHLSKCLKGRDFHSMEAMIEDGKVFRIKKGSKVMVISDEESEILIKDIQTNKSGYIKRNYLASYNIL